jgi:hypothetical protein
MKYSKNDFLFSAALLAIIGVLSFLLYQNYTTRIHAQKDVKPVGTVVYKYHQVKRKYQNRFVWESVRPETPVFLMDSILTQDQSDAVINLNSGVKVEMDANSLVEIDLVDDEVGLRLDKGGVVASGQKGQKAVIATKDGTKVDVSSGKARLNQDDKGLSVSVQKGRVVMSSRQGEEHRLDEGKIAHVDSSGRVSKGHIAVELLSPDNGRTLAITAGRPQKVEFRWRPLKRQKDTTYQLHISRQGDFAKAKVLTTRATRLSLALSKGIWYWKVSEKGKPQNRSHIYSLKLIPKGQITLLAPPAQSTLEHLGRDQAVPFRWLAAHDDAPRHFILAKDAAFRQKVKELRTYNDSVVITGLQAGSYYWRVRQALSPKGKEYISSPTRSFELQSKKGADSQKPEIITDKEQDEGRQIKLLSPCNSSVAAAHLKGGDRLSFRWRPGAGAARYRWVLGEMGSSPKRLLSRWTRQSKITLSMTHHYSGRYYWSVTPYYGGRRGPKSRCTFSFKNPPTPPVVKSVQSQIVD